MLAAARESVVLHADWLCLDDERVEYLWEVEEDLMHITKRFIDTFNQFGVPRSPMPIPTRPRPSTLRREVHATNPQARNWVDTAAS